MMNAIVGTKIAAWSTGRSRESTAWIIISPIPGCANISSMMTTAPIIQPKFSASTVTVGNCPVDPGVLCSNTGTESGLTDTGTLHRLSYLLDPHVSGPAPGSTVSNVGLNWFIISSMLSTPTDSPLPVTRTYSRTAIVAASRQTASMSAPT